METKYIFFRESALQSIIADIFTFGIYVGLLVLNAQHLGNSRFLMVVFSLFLLMFAYARASAKHQTFTNKEDLKKFVNKL